MAQLTDDCFAFSGPLLPIAEMELNGFYLDKGRWREQLDKVTKAQAKFADELQDMLSDIGGFAATRSSGQSSAIPKRLRVSK